MIQSLRAYLRQWDGTPFYMVCDLSFKLTESDFGLAIMAFVYRRYDCHHKEWVTSAMPLAIGWAPKDDEASWSVLLVSVLLFYHRIGIDLLEVGLIGACFWDDSAGGRLAHRRVLGQILYYRCLRHQMAVLRKLPSTHGGAKLGRKVAAQCLFIAAIFDKVLASQYIEAYIADLTSQNRFGLARYLQEYVFTRDEKSGLWGAEWQCGPFKKLCPGFSPATVSQSLERLFRLIKQAMGLESHHQAIGVVTQKVECALRDCVVFRNYIIPHL